MPLCDRISGVCYVAEQESFEWHMNFTIPELSTFSHHVQSTPEQYQKIC